VAPRTRVSSGSSFESTIGFSRAVRVGDRVLVSGTAPVFPDGSCPSEVALQARRCFAIIEAALVEAGASLADVVRTRMLLVDPTDAEAVGAVHGAILGDVRPAATMVAVSALLDPRWKVEIEAEAIVHARLTLALVVDLAVGPRRRGAGHGDRGTDLHRTAVAVDRFVGPPGADGLACHPPSLPETRFWSWFWHPPGAKTMTRSPQAG